MLRYLLIFMVKIGLRFLYLELCQFCSCRFDFSKWLVKQRKALENFCQRCNNAVGEAVDSLTQWFSYFCAIALLRYSAYHHRPLVLMSLCSNKSRKSEQCCQMFKGLHVRRRPIFRPNSSENQKNGLHVRRCPIFPPKSSEDQKKGLTRFMSHRPFSLFASW